MRHRNLFGILLAILVLTAVPAFAGHAWSNYHWGRSCSTCAANITVYNSTITTNTSWPTHLNRAIFGDASNPNTANRRGWNDSAVLNLTIAAGSTTTTTRSSCPAVSGAVRVCNYTYGSNGWLGLAQINLNSSGHIAWGTAKMNDTYFNSGYPSTEKRHVMCQEVGHDFGLGHTSENGSSQNTCMDYYQNTSSTDWTSTGPNQHDFDQLLTQHHYGAKTFIPAEQFSPVVLRFVGDSELNEPWQWGTPIAWDNEGRAIAFSLDIGTDSAGNKHSILTHVYWAHPTGEMMPDGDEKPRTILRK